MLESSPSAASAPSSDSRPPAIPPDRLCRMVTACVARDFNLDVEMLETAPRGSQRAAFARQVAMYLAHVAFGLSFETIGRAFGRDRTTVAHACRVVEDSRDDIWFDCRAATLELMCRAAAARGGR